MKKYIFTVSCILCALLLLYAFIFFNTNTVIEDFVSCVKGDNITKTLKNTELYNWYGKHDYPVNQSDIKIQRCFVVHNFSKGIMYVKYSFENYDENGNFRKGASNIKAKWYIQKQNNRWTVNKIQEKP